MRLRAHFDGSVFIPDEPVDVPLNQPLTLEVALGQLPLTTKAEDADARAVAAYRRLMARPILGPAIPDDQLRRESLYDDHRNRL